MSNHYRIEQDRDVVCLLDAGRLMAAPLGARTRSDAALDAVTAVALVADELGDRCGVTVFDATVRRSPAPRGAAAGAPSSRAILDPEPTRSTATTTSRSSTVGGGKRSLILVFTDLSTTPAARALVRPCPVLTRRHAVIVASVRDPDLDRPAADAAERPDRDVYASAAALDVLDAPAGPCHATRRRRRAVVEAPAPAACSAKRACAPTSASSLWRRAPSAVRRERFGRHAARHNTRPQKIAPSPKPTINAAVETLARRRQEPLDQAGHDSQSACRARSRRPARASRERLQRGACPGRRSPTPAASPRPPRRRCSSSSSTTVRARRARRTVAVPGPREPATAPSIIPFWMSTYSVPRPTGNAAREREERHPDVVGEDLRGRDRIARRRIPEVLIACGARLSHRLARARHERRPPRRGRARPPVAQHAEPSSSATASSSTRPCSRTARQ